MLGFLTAVGMELATGKSVMTQLGGRYVSEALVDKPVGASPLFYGFVIVAITYASFAPLVFGQGQAAERSIGPFTPRAELTNGRAAMLGFAALLVVEAVKGNTALF